MVIETLSWRAKAAITQRLRVLSEPAARAGVCMIHGQHIRISADARATGRGHRVRALKAAAAKEA